MVPGVKLVLAELVVLCFLGPIARADDSTGRRPANDEELRFWLDNLLVQHRFTLEEAALATAMTTDEVVAAKARLAIDARASKPRADDTPLLVLPYPGGRHPRIGFLEGAIDPQRETKLSVFAPWEDGGYVVADVPEAIWMQTAGGRELLYLAHTHVPTHWTKQGVTLPPLEWRKTDDGWEIERTLPNRVVFGTRAHSRNDQVSLEMWLTNGTEIPLRGLVVQNCVMLKGLVGFEQQTNDNKIFRQPFVACHNTDKTRWIITAWEPCQRAWGNPPCPCLHSDPKFPDCEPGQTVRLRGWLSYYQGTQIDAELERVKRLSGQ